jgi:hypothetical protein
MTTPYTSFDHLSDQDLLREVAHLAARERHATAQLIASLAAVDARRLYLTEGFSSLFEYCTDSLRLSEHAAYDRITAARAARSFPVILYHLADGTITLTAVRLLAPHLTDANHTTLLAEARHRSKRDVEHIIARLQPQPDVPASVRKLPAAGRPQQPSGPASTAPPEERVPPPPPKLELGGSGTPEVPPAAGPTPPPPRPAVLAPIAPARYKVSFTIGAETYAKLRQVQDLLRHAVPDANPAVIYDRALTERLSQLMKTKEVTRSRPTGQAASLEPSAHDGGRPHVGATPRSRRIPVDVQRAVWQRDGGQCTFVGRTGRRCTALAWLEFHHTVPFAVGGEATVHNVRLLCRAHNQQQAKRDFGLRDAVRVQETPPTYGASTQQLVAARVDARGVSHFSGLRVNLRCRPAWRSSNPMAFPAPSIKKTSSAAASLRRTWSSTADKPNVSSCGCGPVSPRALRCARGPITHT